MIMSNKTNTNTEEWGNIELPGLSDEVLYKKNWNRVAINKERFSDVKFREKHKKSIIDAVNTEEVKRKKKLAQKKFRTDEYNKNHQKVMADLYKSSRWKESVLNANKNPVRNQKIREALSFGVHTPLGEFQTLGQAAIAHNITSEGIRYRIKTKPKDYYYLKK